MDDSLSLDYSVTGTYSKYSNKYMGGVIDSDEASSSNYMDFDSYLKLLVAQMQNQDFNDPMSDSEVLAQMAQYSMLEGIKNMTQQSNTSYAMSLVGKAVTVNLGGEAYMTGNVEAVTMVDGEPYLMINGSAYKPSEVTDIVDPAVFKQLSDMVGKTYKTKTTNEEDSITGKVTSVLFLYGESYAVINGQPYPVSYLQETEPVEDENSGENAEGAEGDKGTDAVDPADGTEGSETEGVSNSETISAYAADKSSSYLARSQELVDILMKELDSIDETKSSSSVNSEAAEPTSSTGSLLTPADVDMVLRTAYVEVPDFASGSFASTANVYADNYISTDDYDSGDDEGGIGIDGDDIRRALATGEPLQLFAGSTSTTSGLQSSSVSGSTLMGSGNTSSSSSAASGNAVVKGVTAEPSISRGDGTPHRISVEDYPEEAALADALGTRMYDIRYIGNTAITSRINTDTIIGYTADGKAITEIGYSGVGRLGEVITYADGTQRVEVLLRHGKSCWYHTSGNYTLDEICNRSGAPGSLAGKLTPFESAIRHFSEPMDDDDKADALKAFENYIKSGANTVGNA